MTRARGCYDRIIPLKPRVWEMIHRKLIRRTRRE